MTRLSLFSVHWGNFQSKRILDFWWISKTLAARLCISVSHPPTPCRSGTTISLKKKRKLHSILVKQLLILISEKYEVRVIHWRCWNCLRVTTQYILFFSQWCKITHLVHNISSVALIALQARKLKSSEDANTSPWDQIFLKLMCMQFDLSFPNFDAGASSRK